LFCNFSRSNKKKPEEIEILFIVIFFFGGRKGGMGRERCFAMSVLEFVQCFKQKEVEEVIGVLLMEVFVWCCF